MKTMTRKAQEPSITRRRDKSRIPRFKSVEEAAEFWDTHDLTEFEDELEEVTDVKFVRAQPKKPITVRIEEDSLDILKQQAREKGVGPSTLVRMWILEHLRHHQQ